MFNFETKALVSRKPNKADSALMHPQQNIIALRAKGETEPSTVIQIFNLDEKSRLKHVEILESVVFWKWVTLTKLAFVTTSAVYHLNIANPNEQ